MEFANKMASMIDDLKELYTYRSTLKALIFRNLFGRYKNTLLGFAWNFITPMVYLALYILLFGELQQSTDIDNRGIFICVSLFLFFFLTDCIVGGTRAFTDNANMIKKLYVPKEILVLAKVLTSLIICTVGYFIVLVYLIFVSYNIDILCVLLLPLLIVLSFIFALGCVFLLSTLTVYVRDIQYVLSSLSIAFFVLTPMRYMASSAQGLMATIIWFNPLTYYIEAAHDLLYWCTIPDSSTIIICVSLSFVMFIIGYLVFRVLKHGFVKRL